MSDVNLQDPACDVQQAFAAFTLFKTAERACEGTFIVHWFDSALNKSTRSLCGFRVLSGRIAGLDIAYDAGSFSIIRYGESSEDAQHVNWRDVLLDVADLPVAYQEMSRIFSEAVVKYAETENARHEEFDYAKVCKESFSDASRRVVGRLNAAAMRRWEKQLASAKPEGKRK